jgi:hypothetical protein
MNHTKRSRWKVKVGMSECRKPFRPEGLHSAAPDEALTHRGEDCEDWNPKCAEWAAEGQYAPPTCFTSRKMSMMYMVCVSALLARNPERSVSTCHSDDCLVYWGLCAGASARACVNTCACVHACVRACLRVHVRMVVRLNGFTLDVLSGCACL